MGIDGAVVNLPKTVHEPFGLVGDHFRTKGKSTEAIVLDRWQFT